MNLDCSDQTLHVSSCHESLANWRNFNWATLERSVNMSRAEECLNKKKALDGSRQWKCRRTCERNTEEAWKQIQMGNCLPCHPHAICWKVCKGFYLQTIASYCTVFAKYNKAFAHTRSRAKLCKAVRTSRRLEQHCILWSQLSTFFRQTFSAKHILASQIYRNVLQIIMPQNQQCFK